MLYRDLVDSVLSVLRQHRPSREVHRLVFFVQLHHEEQLDIQLAASLVRQQLSAGRTLVVRERFQSARRGRAPRRPQSVALQPTTRVTRCITVSTTSCVGETVPSFGVASSTNVFGRFVVPRI